MYVHVIYAFNGGWRDIINKCFHSRNDCEWVGRDLNHLIRVGGLYCVCDYLHYKIQKLNLFEITAHDFCAVITLFDHTGLSGVFCNISTCICGIQC